MYRGRVHVHDGAVRSLEHVHVEVDGYVVDLRPGVGQSTGHALDMDEYVFLAALQEKRPEKTDLRGTAECGWVDFWSWRSDVHRKRI